MKEKLRQFMIGRYGVDDLSRAQIIVSMVLLLVSTFLSAFFRVNILYWLGLALLIYSYFRILSRNVSKRYEENQRYLNAKYRAVVKKNNLKNAGHSAVLTVSLNVRSVSRQSGCRREEERSALPVQNVKQNLLKKLTKEKGLVFGYININQKELTEEGKKHIRHITVGFADN